jgi:hypothetical protein
LLEIDIVLQILLDVRGARQLTLPAPAASFSPTGKRFGSAASSNTETLRGAIDSATSVYTVLSDVTP